MTASPARMTLVSAVRGPGRSRRTPGRGMYCAHACVNVSIGLAIRAQGYAGAHFAIRSLTA